MTSQSRRLVGLVMLGWVCIGACDENTTADRFARLGETIESERGDASAAVAVVHEGRVVYARGFGPRDRGEPASPTVEPTTLFPIGSTTKLLTAVALLRSLQGTVTLDTPLVDVVPGFSLSHDAAAVPGLTLRHLLEQTSGLVDTTGRPPPGTSEDLTASAFYESSAYASSGYFMVPPGTLWNYSNDNFALAGLALEALTGSPYERALADAVLEPLGMTRTFVGSSDVLSDGDFAHGFRAATSVPPTDGDYRRLHAAQGVFSSALDLARLAVFLTDGDEAVLPDDVRRSMLAPRNDTGVLSIDGIYYRTGYGLGAFTWDGFVRDGEYHPVRITGHDGNNGGCISMLYLAPDSRFGFVALVGANDVFLDRSFAVALEIAAGLPPGETPPSLGPSDADLDRFAGTYFEPTLGTIQVAHVGTSLTISIPSLDSAGTAYGIAAEYGSTFLLSGVRVHPLYAERRTTFVLPTTGPATHLRNRWWVATRQ